MANQPTRARAASNDSEIAFRRRLGKISLLSEQLPSKVLDAFIGADDEADDELTVSGGHDWEPADITRDQRSIHYANRR
jgi:hypothetical protein